MIKWNVLTSEQRDRLVAEKVMGWVDHICEDGTLHEVEGGWECGKCGLTGDWNNFDNHASHLELPPKYAQDMNAAWEIVERMKQDRIYSRRLQFWNYVQSGISVRLKSPDGANVAYPDLLWSLTAEDICVAALKKCGVEID